MQKWLEKRQVKLYHPNFFLLFMGGLSCFLCACSTDAVPDEEFEAPTLNFPLLGTVPERPLFPPSEKASHQKKRLQQERDQAAEKRHEIMGSLKP
jgi:hypothetical protein